MIKSEDRIIAFIDILGFKNIVVNASKTNDYTKIFKLIKKSLNIFSSLNKNIDFQFTHFSDSFVLSLRDFNINQSMLFLILLQELIDNFLWHNILLRGGITIGKVVHSKKILLGVGMIRAYELESKFAKFPRIIIDEELVGLWETQLCEYNFENVFELSKDNDGFYFMDYIAKSNLLSEKRLEVVTCIASNLISSSDKKLKQKGIWLRKKVAHGRKNLKMRNVINKPASV